MSKEEKKGATFLLRPDVIEKIKRMAKKWDFVRMSRLIDYIILKHQEDDPVITVPLIRNISVNKVLEGLILLAEEDAKRISKRSEKTVLDFELAMCPLRREYHMHYPHLIMQEFLDPAYIYYTAIKLGLRAAATINPFCLYSYKVIKKVKVDNETWTLDITIDIKLPGRVWYICRGTMDAKSALMAWIYKCATKAEHAFVVSFVNNRIYEIEITANHLQKFAEDLGLNLKDADTFLRDLVIINVKKLKVPLWEKECEHCPYKAICTLFRGKP